MREMKVKKAVWIVNKRVMNESIEPCRDGKLRLG